MLIEILIIFLRVVGHEHFRRELTRQHQACHPPRSMEAPKPHEDHSIHCLWVSGKQQHQLQFPDPFPSPEDSSTASLLLPPYLAKKNWTFSACEASFYFCQICFFWTTEIFFSCQKDKALVVRRGRTYQSPLQRHKSYSVIKFSLLTEVVQKLWGQRYLSIFACPHQKFCTQVLQTI